MDLDSFKKDFPSITFYLSENGMITCDEQHHKSLLKMHIVKNWDSFVKCTGHATLYNLLTSIDNDSVLRFLPNGQVDNSVDAYNKIRTCCNRLNFITSVYSAKRGIISSLFFICLLVISLITLSGTTVIQQIYNNINSDYLQK